VEALGDQMRICTWWLLFCEKLTWTLILLVASDSFMALAWLLWMACYISLGFSLQPYILNYFLTSTL